MHILHRVIFLKKAFVISGVFISSLVGAGFASGSEILYYFSRYGAWGFFGIVFCSVLFGILQYLIVSHTSDIPNSDFEGYLKMITGKKLAVFISVFAHIFMLLVFSAMLSGFSQMCLGLWGIKRIYSSALMLILSMTIIFSGYDTFVKSQSVLCISIVGTITICSLYILLFRESDMAVFSLYNNAFTSGLSYVSYNILTTSAVLCILGKNCTKNTILLSSVFTAVILIVIMSVMWYILCLYSGMITLGQLPFLTVCLRQSKLLGLFYSSAIFFSMLTTAVSNGYTLNIRIKSRIVKLSAFMLAFGLSAFEFSFIVDKLYRLAGIISIIFLICVIKYSINNKKYDILRKQAKY